MDGAKKSAAEHRGQSQRNKAGDQNRNANRQSKFVEQSSKDPPHEQDRNENGDEGESHRDNGEADLF